MDKLREQLMQKKKEIKTYSVQEKKQEIEQQKQNNIDLRLKSEKDEHEKFVKKLRLQNDYYKTVEIDKVVIKKLNEVTQEIVKDVPNIMKDNLPSQTDLPPVEKKEVQKRLRDLGHPITYFAETDWQRYKRLLQAELKKNENQIDDQDFFQRNVKEEIFLLDGEDLEDVKAFMSKIKERNLDPNTALVPVFNQMQGKEEVESYLLEGVSILTRCEDVHLWCRKMLREWNIKLEQKFTTETDKRSLEGSLAFSAYKQTLEYIKPLTEQLQKVNLNPMGVNEEILNALYLIIRFCVYKEYVRAHDKYLELAIGNAPWPMGVTMVGIHERTGRSKISSSQIAHILNDETQRKYIQAIKRLITVSQKSYPSIDRSKMVDFRTEYAW